MSMEQNEQARQEQQATMQSLRGQTYSRSPARKQKSTSSFSWVLVIFLFIVCWPVGLALTIWKLAQGKSAKTPAQRQKAARPDNGRKTARNLQIIGTVLTVIGGLVVLPVVGDLGFYLEYGDFWWFFEDVVMGAAILTGGISLLALGGSFAADRAFHTAVQGLCWLVALVTVLSGGQYIWQNRRFINTAK